MKLLIIRHGDPYYSIDGLTEKGKREAGLLADRLMKENVSAVYCSTLGRARCTAEPFLLKSGLPCEYCEWLREFDYAKVRFPYLDRDKGCWDVLPRYIEQLPEIYHPTKWLNSEFLRNSEVETAYNNVTSELDRVLEKHGYKREGYNYRAVRPNHDTVVMFCHYGLTAVLLSHIMNCSPYSIWQHAFVAPTAVTVIYTEEREEGIAAFRVSALGDVSHLYKEDEPPSFSGRFCECFTDDTRHH